MRTQVAVMVVGIGALVVIAGASVRAHHAFAAEFDANSPIELTGTVVRMEWVNPHTWIHIDVQQDDGVQVNRTGTDSLVHEAEMNSTSL